MRKISLNNWLIVALVLVVIAGGIFFARQKTDLGGSKYSAVFLTNGQVYFGNIEKQDKSIINLVDIYYLQVNQGQGLQNGSTNNGTTPDISLVKLGNELHGPTDRMVISRDQVLFTETLKSDSKVVTAINNFKK